MKKVQFAVKRFIDTVSQVYLFLGVASLVICVGSTILGVIMRYIFNNPLDWVEELSALSQAWMVCFIIPELDNHYGHITMEILFNARGKVYQTIIRILQSIVTCAMSVYLMKFAIKVILLNAKTKVVTGALLIPMKYVYLALPIAFVFLAIVHVGKIITQDIQLPEKKAVQPDAKEAE